MNEQNEFPSPIGAFFIEWEDGVSYQEEDESFRPLLGLFFIELWKNYCSQLTKWLISVPYWGFFLLNQEYFFTMKVQNIVSVPYWGFFLLNNSCRTRLWGHWYLVSVPYWGFFLLNQKQAKKRRAKMIKVSVPYWGFFLLNLLVFLLFL